MKQFYRFEHEALEEPWEAKNLENRPEKRLMGQLWFNQRFHDDLRPGEQKYEDGKNGPTNATWETMDGKRVDGLVFCYGSVGPFVGEWVVDLYDHNGVLPMLVDSWSYLVTDDATELMDITGCEPDEFGDLLLTQ